MKKNETDEIILSKRFILITIAFIAACIAIMAFTKINSCNAFVKPIAIEADLSENSAVPESEKVNINTASLSELTTLSGIGEVTAQSIIEYREKNNGFLDIEEIMKVSGIGEAKFEAIRDYITVG